MAPCPRTERRVAKRIRTGGRQYGARLVRLLFPTSTLPLACAQPGYGVALGLLRPEGTR